MARTPKPWYRADRDAWFVCLNGRQVLLAKGKKNKAQAQQAFYEQMLGQPGGPPKRGYRLDAVIDAFLDHARAELAPATYESYRRLLKGLRARHGGLPVDELRVLHIHAWLATQTTWTAGSQRMAATCVKAMSRWAHGQGLMTTTYLKALKPVLSVPVRHFATARDIEVIRTHVDAGDAAEALAFVWETGCRLGEVVILTAADVDLERGVATVLRHKGIRESRRAKTIVLSPRAQAIVQAQMARYPTGALFRTARGTPTNKNALQYHWKRLVRKGLLPEGTSARAMRHGFAVDGLSRGVPTKIVAELLGHATAQMVDQVYGNHFGATAELLRGALESFRPDGKR